MRPAATLLVVVAGAALLGVGVWTVRQDPARHPDTTASPATLAFPNLAADLQQAAKIEITRNGQSVRIERGLDGDWGVRNLGGYPVQPQILHAMLAGLAGLRLLERRTDNPDLFDRLGVADPKAENAAQGGGVLVRVQAASGQNVAALIIGRHPSAAEGADDRRAGGLVYVRRPNQAQSWLAEGDVALPDAAADWVDHVLVDIPPDQVSLVVSRMAMPVGSAAEAERIDIGRDENGRLELRSPQEPNPVAASLLEAVAGAYHPLQFADVRPAEPPPGRRLARSDFLTIAGLSLTARLDRDDTRVWAMFEARGSGPARAVAEALNARFSGWAFALPPGVENRLAPQLATLGIAPPAVPEAAASLPGPVPAPAPAPAAATPAAVPPPAATPPAATPPVATP